MPHHPRTPLPPQPDADATAAIQDMDKLSLIELSHAHSAHGPAKPCCRSSEATDARMTRMGDPLSHAGDEPTVMPTVLDPGATLPARAHPEDAGLDLKALSNLPEPIRLLPGQIKIVPTGVRVAIMPGYVGKLEGRSGLSSRGIVPLGAMDMGDVSPEVILGGLIDENFIGPIGIILANVGLHHWVAEEGKSLCQLVEYKIARRTPMAVDRLEKTARGEGGFGHTDHKAVAQ